MNGFYGRILKIDLSRKSFAVDPVDDHVLQTYLGGKGLASHLLFTLNPPHVDATTPENCLIFATGPVGGSPVWGSSRYGVFTKSPLTGIYLESYSGGKVPEAIDATGFDAVVISGQLTEPGVLSIHPDEVLFHDAADLWGQETFATEDAALERFGISGDAYKKPGAVVIGPASENGVQFGILANDYWRCAGRGGAGTVMGSKRLKAIVFQGDRKRKLFDAEAVSRMTKEMGKSAKDNPAAQAYRSMGTTMMVDLLNSAGAFPTRYWSQGICDHRDQINADALHRRCSVKPHACLKCFMACGRMTTLKQGRHAGLTLEGPEYETIYAFGGLCMIDSIEEIVFLNDICDRLGMDTITAGNLCGLAIEAGRRGRIDMRIDYGDTDAIAGLLHAIARREGIGHVLACGIRHAAAAWGLEDVAVHVNGMEPPGYDPRVLKGMGLSYATSDRGACHLRATFYKPELSGMIAPNQIQGKAEMFTDFEDRLTLFDCLILCRFYRDQYGWDALEKIVRATTGLEMGKKALQRVAGSVSTLVRRFNLREGLAPKDDDRLPPRLHQPLETGQVITEEELDRMLQDYYRLRGWQETGLPAD
jgi:aldehyde:ferredoxin oxidoreductase